ncbi:hypothetical protein [Roseibium sediminicola]|uniref:50S ribosomal protein L2 n=1 Tax=Roseibium sediminicola TaxID=2933272 RepID=A0ABT0H3B2_9HYPH|nr:hypothetical protein [Roseibium sp. CAU 1639]MCK7615583.1 hypothetical protein [Roseibium sp. CAU 1639]
MSATPPKNPLKSVAGTKPLRSRGFLSAPGGKVSVSTGETSDAAENSKHHRSRGARQVFVTSDGKPQDLSVKPKIRPYSLEDK